MEELTGKQLKKFIIGGYNNLQVKKAEIDELNVFPVPDGDTGTNMFLTHKTAVTEIASITEQDINIKSIAEAFAKGTMKGSRGNSGVILSQICRGIAQGLISNKDRIGAKEFANALQMGIETAYKQIKKPVEGTILTVARETAQAAVEKANSSTNIITVLMHALQAGELALKKTPEQLPVLKQAGVVDAGGKGFLVILEGGLWGLQGIEIDINVDEQPEVRSDRQAINISDIEIEFRYCTEFLITGDNLPIESIRIELEELGDSLIVVGNEEMGKVHIHTNRPGLILEKCISYGELHEIQIHNMVDQSKEKVNKSQENQQEENIVKDIGIVSVAMGEGLEQILTSMGVDKVVTGGQTMNPSTEDLLAAIEQVNAKEIIILPNNSNIILAAEQTKEIYKESKIAIVPTKSIPQAIGALIAFDPDESLENNIEAMTESIQAVKTGEITYAIRDSEYEGMEISEGQILGLIEGKISNLGEEIQQVVLDTIKAMITEETEIITLFYGKDLKEDDVQSLQEALLRQIPEIEIETHYGGQPLYYYLIAVE